MYKIVLLILLSIVANAGSLTLSKGQITAHTEVFGDSAINPTTSKINSKLHRNNTLESIRGEISITAVSLKSDNSDRDEHMYEAINAKDKKIITLQIENIVKNEKDYTIQAILTLNGVQKNITSSSFITEKNDDITIVGAFHIKMSDYAIEPPSLLFFTVRDQIDITYNLNYKDK